MRQKRIWIFVAGIILVLLFYAGWQIERHSFRIEDIVEAPLDQIDSILASTEISACRPNDPSLRWAHITTPEDVQEIYDIIRKLPMKKSPMDPNLFPSGGGWQHFRYIQLNGEVVEFSLLDGYILRFDGIDYCSRDRFELTLSGELDATLNKHEFVPYVDLAMQGYLPLQVSHLIPVPLEEIKCILVEKPVGDEALLPDYVRQWAAITAEDHSTPIFNALQTTELIPVPLNSSDYPTGGTTQQIIYQLQDDTEIKFLLYDKSILRVGDTDFKYRSSSNNNSPSLRSVLKTVLRQYEFAPLE